MTQSRFNSLAILHCQKEGTDKFILLPLLMNLYRNMISEDRSSEGSTQKISLIFEIMINNLTRT